MVDLFSLWFSSFELTSLCQS